MRLYKYLYYKLYCLWLKKKDETESAYINAVISISLLLGFNIASIPMILMAIFGKDSIPFPELPSKWILYLIVIAFGVSQYFLLAHKKKYLKIVDEFKKETESQSRKGFLYTWIYIVITIGIPFYIVIFATPK